jgi:hypothetical protein
LRRSPGEATLDDGSNFAKEQIKGLNSAKRKRPPCYGRSGRLCYNCTSPPDCRYQFGGLVAGGCDQHLPATLLTLFSCIIL